MSYLMVCHNNCGTILERHNTLLHEVALVLGLPAQVEKQELGPHRLRGPDVYTTVNDTDYALEVTTAMVDQVDGLQLAQAAVPEVFPGLGM